MNLLTIISVENTPFGFNSNQSKKERTGSGTYIEFYSSDQIKKDDYYNVIYNKLTYNFKVTGFKVVEDLFLVTAKETGYWLTTTTNKGIDLRELIGLEVIPVKDKDLIEEIDMRSRWC